MASAALLDARWRIVLRVAGAGSLSRAATALDCLAALRTVASACVFSPTLASRERFAAGFQAAIAITAARAIVR